MLINGSSTSWFSKGDVVVVLLFLLLGSKEIDLENRAHRPELRARPRVGVDGPGGGCGAAYGYTAAPGIVVLAGLDRVATTPARSSGGDHYSARAPAGRVVVLPSCRRGRRVVRSFVVAWARVRRFPSGSRPGAGWGVTDLHPGAVTADVVPVPVCWTRPGGQPGGNPDEVGGGSEQR